MRFNTSDVVCGVVEVTGVVVRGIMCGSQNILCGSQQYPVWWSVVSCVVVSSIMCDSQQYDVW